MIETEFVQRQLEFLQEGGRSRGEALDRLREVLPATAITGIKVEPTDALSRHLQRYEVELGSHYNEVVAAVISMRREVAAALRPIWRSYHSVAVHFGLVTAVAWVMFSGLGLFVLPQFEQIFSSSGSELPGLTRWAAAPGPRMFWLLILTICSVALFWLPRTARRTATLARQVGGDRFARVWLGRSAEQVWQLIELSAGRAAVQSGMPIDSALDFARRMINDWTGTTATAADETLSACARLGTLESEFDHRIYTMLSNLPLRASARREVIGLVISVILGMVIGLLIIAMYIPIFRLAVVI